MIQIISKKNIHGFTLVETLVAITVLLLVIVGPMTIAQKGIQNAYYANEQVTAVFLAQEALEAVRELRDAYALDTYDKLVDGSSLTTGYSWGWYTDLQTDTPSCMTTGCAFNIEDVEFGSCTSNSLCRLQIDTDGRYTHGSGTESPFTRTVSIGSAVSGGAPVTVDVSWESRIFGGTTRHVILQTWIYDQYQRYEN